MTDSAIARSAALLLMLVAGGAPAIASTHHHADRRHETRHHASTARHHATSSHRRATTSHRDRPPAADRHDAKPSGVTSIPAGGIKLFCPAHRNPLLIRKSTQGAGTTVTVVCR